jgi:hypothetical protein
MGIRQRLASVVLGNQEESVRESVEEALTQRNLVKPSELASLKSQVDDMAGSSTGSAPTGDLADLQHQIEAAKQDLKMVLGALEAANKQLQEVKGLAEQALASARQAGQHSTTARATAEATADGLSSLENRFAALIERLGAAGLDWNRTTTGGRATCTVDSCNSRHHARGLCKKHYRLWSRNMLENWVGPDGVVPFSEDGSIYKVNRRYAAQTAALFNGEVRINDKAVEAQRVDV